MSMDEFSELVENYYSAAKLKIASWKLIVLSWIWSIFGTLVILIVLVTAFIYYVRGKTRRVLSKEEVAEFEMGWILPNRGSIEENQPNSDKNYQQASASLPYSESYEIPKKNVSYGIFNIVSRNRYCSIYSALLKMGERKPFEVALKMPRKRTNRDAVKAVLAEIKTLLFVGKHENIVSFVGSYTREIENGMVYLLCDMCALGPIEIYLHRVKDRTAEILLAIQVDKVMTLDDVEYRAKYDNDYVVALMKLGELYRFANEILSGMKFLVSKKVVHGDISTHNVLLTWTKTAKLTNIGVDKRKNMIASCTDQNLEPVRWQWLARESLEDLVFSTESDVWAYAVTLFEIFNMGIELPYSGIEWNKVFLKRLSEGERIKKPFLSTTQLYGIMLDCWKLDTKSRPSIDYLRQLIIGIQEDVAKAFNRAKPKQTSPMNISRSSDIESYSADVVRSDRMGKVISCTIDEVDLCMANAVSSPPIVSTSNFTETTKKHTVQRKKMYSRKVKRTRHRKARTSNEKIREVEAEPNKFAAVKEIEEYETSDGSEVKSTDEDSDPNAKRQSHLSFG